MFDNLSRSILRSCANITAGGPIQRFPDVRSARDTSATWLKSEVAVKVLRARWYCFTWRLTHPLTLSRACPVRQPRPSASRRHFSCPEAEEDISNSVRLTAADMRWTTYCVVADTFRQVALGLHRVPIDVHGGRTPHLSGDRRARLGR
jgi:hypothetical protein